MSGDLPIGETFGNYLIHGISEIKEPGPIPWTPQAPGWLAVWMILFLLSAWILFRTFKKWRKNAYRRAALSAIRKLQETETENTASVLSTLPRILKGTALYAYPRTAVASLSGDPWIHFLESRYPGEGFNRAVAGNLVTIAYQPPEKWGIGVKEAAETIALVKNWIRLHDRRNQDA